MTLFICTAGTSIARGGMKAGVDAVAYRARIEEKLREDRAATSDREAFLKLASAESNGLLRGKATADDEVVFLVSETEDGAICGERLVSFVKSEFGCRAKTVEIKGLQVRDGRTFRAFAIGSLFAALDREIDDRPAEEVRLNATGGFKGTIPYLVLYGMFNSIPVSYVYEFSDTLIVLPPVPIEFDWARIAPAARAVFEIGREGYLEEDRWRKLLPRDYYLYQSAYDTLFEFDGNIVGLSAVGHIMRRRFDLAIVSTDVRLSPNAQRALNRADAAIRREFEIMLDRVRDPIARKLPHHQDSLYESDLKVWKRYVRAGPRMCYWVEGQIVYVAELFPTHPEYDRFWKEDPRDRADYERPSFIQHEVAAPPDYRVMLEDMQRSGLDDQEYQQALEDEAQSLRRQLEQLTMRTNALVAEARREGRAEAEHARRRMESNLSKKIAAGKNEIVSLTETLEIVVAERDRLRAEIVELDDQAYTNLSAESSGSPE
ncbi:MAG: putative CRISPR-associated protein [Hyphomicrobiales bacterium]